MKMRYLHMLGRGVAIAAVVVYLGVLGLVFWPAQSPAGRDAGDLGDESRPAPRAASQARPVSVEGLPFRGVAVQIQRVDWVEQYKKTIDEIAALGADTVSLVVDSRQENGSSSRIYLDMRMTPTPEQLSAVMKHAKGKGLRVILVPIVLLDAPRGNEWRGSIKPEDWGEWFNSYREMMRHFAWVAQGNGVDVLTVGSELVTAENHPEEWTRTIQEVRKVYTGRLTYSSNWDHYWSIPFWDELDLIAMNSYWKLGEDHKVTVAQIQQNWKKIQKDLLEFVREKRKPLLFLEVGWCSLQNAAHESWDYTKASEPIDLELQRKLYEAFFKSWHGNELLGGYIVWEWPPGDGGKEDRGYTPENKPAEAVLREWLARPKWEVRVR